jgi:hypothetical protein
MSNYIVHQIEENDNPIYIDPKQVGCGFVMIPEKMSKTIKNESFVHEALNYNITKLWLAVRKYQPNIPVYLFVSFNADPNDPRGIISLLEVNGKYPEYSIGIGNMRLSLDGGITYTSFWAGLNWKSYRQEIYVAAQQMILPKVAKSKY